ncbi:NepR family anti-sigma factor [Pacificibacter sp. AS14]
MDQHGSKTPLEEQIEENLRKVYQKTLNEQVPDRFMDLLEKLRQQDEKHG